MRSSSLEAANPACSRFLAEWIFWYIDLTFDGAIYVSQASPFNELCLHTVALINFSRAKSSILIIGPSELNHPIWSTVYETWSFRNKKGLSAGTLFVAEVFQLPVNSCSIWAQLRTNRLMLKNFATCGEFPLKLRFLDGLLICSCLDSLERDRAHANLNLHLLLAQIRPLLVVNNILLCLLFVCVAKQNFSPQPISWFGISICPNVSSGDYLLLQRLTPAVAPRVIDSLVV